MVDDGGDDGDDVDYANNDHDHYYLNDYSDDGHGYHYGYHVMTDDMHVDHDYDGHHDYHDNVLLLHHDGQCQHDVFLLP